MATDTAEQLELINVEPENAKKIKRLIRQRNDFNELHLDNKRKADEKDVEIMDEIRKTGAKPDANGVLRVKVGDSIIQVSPGKAKLKIEEKEAETAKEDEPDEVEQQQLEGSEQVSRRGRVGNRGQ
jgi:hypothetical protein